VKQSHTVLSLVALAVRMPWVYVACAGLGIVYMVTGGSSMLRVWQLYGDNEATPFGLSAWILVFFGLQLFLSQVSHDLHRCTRLPGLIACNMAAG
jgi:amino acid permease